MQQAVDGVAHSQVPYSEAAIYVKHLRGFPDICDEYSLFLERNSLLSAQKFPVPFLREF